MFSLGRCNDCFAPLALCLVRLRIPCLLFVLRLSSDPASQVRLCARSCRRPSTAPSRATRPSTRWSPSRHPRTRYQQFGSEHVKRSGIEVPDVFTRLKVSSFALSLTSPSLLQLRAAQDLIPMLAPRQCASICVFFVSPTWD